MFHARCAICSYFFAHSNWLLYLMQLLLGTEHYGMKVGEIFHGDVRVKRDGIHANRYFFITLSPAVLFLYLLAVTKATGSLIVCLLPSEALA